MRCLSIEINEAFTYIVETDYVSKLPYPPRILEKKEEEGEQTEGENAEAEQAPPVEEAPPEPAPEELTGGSKKLSKKAMRAQARKAARGKHAKPASKEKGKGNRAGKGDEGYSPMSMQIYRSMSFPTPEDIFEDGLIKDPEVLGKFLSEKLITQRIKTRSVIFSISSSRIAVRDVVIPKIKPNKILNLVEANASEYFPVDIEKYRISYDIKDENAEGGSSFALQVLAAPIDILQSYYRTCVFAGLKVLGIDYMGHSVLSSLYGRIGTEVCMVAKIDNSQSLLTIFKNGCDILQRSISYGVEDAVNIAAERYETSFEEAVPLFYENDFFVRQESEQTMTEEEEETGSGNPYVDSVDMLCSGIARVVDYYNSRNADARITKIYITGLAAGFNGLERLIGSAAGCEAYAVGSLPGISFSEDQGAAAARYFSVLGSAMGPVDLMIEDERTKRKRQQGLAGMIRVNPLYIAAAILFVGTAAITAYSLITENVLKQKNKELTNERENLIGIMTVYHDYQEQEALYNEVTHIYDLTRSRNEELKGFVEELERKMPSRAYLSSFVSDGQTASASVTCSSKEEAGNFIETLRNFSSIQEITVTGVSEDKDELTGAASCTFSVSIVYEPLEPMDSNIIRNLTQRGGGGSTTESSGEVSAPETEKRPVLEENVPMEEMGGMEGTEEIPYMPIEEGGSL